MDYKLNLDQGKIIQAREKASAIADSLHSWIGSYTTTTIERSTARLLGVDGIDRGGVPLANVIVEKLQQAGLINQGLVPWLAKAMIAVRESPQKIAEALAEDILKVDSIADCPAAEWQKLADEKAKEAADRIRKVRVKRGQMIESAVPLQKPLLYVIVSTGNIYEDALQGKAAALQGADCISLLRHTGQSLLDYVPYGATTEGFGGTYATQENFRIMREALDEAGRETGRYIMLVNYASGLCMPEISVMGAFEGLDIILNDAMYGILFRDINMKRTLIDQHFSRMIKSYAGIMINTGEDNFLTTVDALEKGYTVIVSQLINEQLALRSGLKEEQIGLAHAYEIDPSIEDGILMEIAQARLCREIFPRSPMKYNPPTKHITGDIFKTYLINGMSNLTSVLTGQEIHCLGMLTEAIHTPFISDRYLSIANAKYVYNNARHLGDEILFAGGGRIQNRAAYLLDMVLAMLEKVEKIGLEEALEQGMFADIKRFRQGGKGYEDVIVKGESYYNPFHDIFLNDSENNRSATGSTDGKEEKI